MPDDGVSEDGLSLAYEPVPVKSSVPPSGLCSIESEGNPGEIFAALGFLDGIEFPMEKDKKVFVFTVTIQGSRLTFQLTSPVASDRFY